MAPHDVAGNVWTLCIIKAAVLAGFAPDGRLQDVYRQEGEKEQAFDHAGRIPFGFDRVRHPWQGFQAQLGIM